jgi:hypothetical protein
VNSDNPDSEWFGTIKRINGKVDQSTQTVQIFIQISGTGLKEGMYLQAHIEGKNANDAIEIDRSLLVNESSVYIVNESKLTLVPIEPVYFNQNSVIVRGLQNGAILVTKPVPGAYDSMEVTIYQ